MATGFFRWSRTAASNASATYTWAEGMAPSSVNDSARGIMSDAAQFRDDISGAIATGGTSTAYTVTSFQVFDSLANMSGNLIAFTPHATNGATVTLNVDGLGAKPLRSAPSVELLAGTLIQGTPYLAIYNNSDAVWYLHGFYGNPYNIPLAGGMPFFATAVPNSSFAFPYGQAVSRTTYSALFALLSTNFGVGDGSTTFNLPDMRGRVPAGGDAMGGVAASRLTATSGLSNLFTAGGAETHTMTTAEMPTHSHGVTDSGHGHPSSHGDLQGTGAGGNSPNAAHFGQTDTGVQTAQNLTIATNTTGISIQNAGSGGAHNNVQPTIVCNYILRII